MKKLILFLTVSILITNVFAQRKLTVVENNGVDKYHEGAFESKLNEPDFKSNVKGNRYFHEDYNDGEVITRDKHHYTTDLKYKFDEYKNAVQIKVISDKKELMLFNNNIDTFRLFMDNRLVTYIKAIVPEENDLHKLYQVIHWGTQVKMIKMPRKRIVKVTNSDVFSAGETYDQFENQDWYYLKMNDRPFMKIKISKKSLFEAMPEKKRLLTKLFDTPQYKGELTDVKLEKLIQDIDKASNSQAID